MKKFQTFGLLAILVIGGGFMLSSDQIAASISAGAVPQPTPRRRVSTPRSNTPLRPANTNSNVGYIGGSDDGQSIRRRQENSNQHVNTNGAVVAPHPSNTNTTTTPKRPKRRPKTN